MRTKIVLIPVTNIDARAICEANENWLFETIEAIQERFGSDAIIQDITDFMDDFNNQELDESKYFMSYALLKN